MDPTPQIISSLLGRVLRLLQSQLLPGANAWGAELQVSLSKQFLCKAYAILESAFPKIAPRFARPLGPVQRSPRLWASLFFQYQPLAKQSLPALAF